MVTQTQWIKLFYEILEDPKMGRMPDSLWRFCVELFLLAGKTQKGGMLPTVADIAWCLRMDEGTVAQYLNELTDLGIAEESDGEYSVANFAERQGMNTASNGAERVRKYRESKKAERNADETDDVTPCNVTCNVTCNADVTDGVTPDVTLHVTDDVTPCNAHIKNREDKNRLDKSREEEIKSVNGVSQQRNAPAPSPEKKTGKAKPERHKYGQYGRVLLSDKQLDALKAEYPASWDYWIDRVDSYCASHGKTYNDYLATIRNWARRDGNVTVSTPEEPPKMKSNLEILNELEARGEIVVQPWQR